MYVSGREHARKSKASGEYGVVFCANREKRKHKRGHMTITANAKHLHKDAEEDEESDGKF